MAIVASILWRRVDAPGHDACKLEDRRSGWRLQGAAIFRHSIGPASVSYTVDCDSRWRTLSGRVYGTIGEREIDYHIARRDDAWLLNGESVPGVGHLVDLDLSFTPATNLLQVKRVPLPVGEPISLPAAWFNLDTGALTELEQIYERRSEHALFYRAPGVGYDGLIELAPNGFITRYPGLWQAE
jgi:uncharacterized protein